MTASDGDCDVAVIGAGAFGLWTARACLAQGLTVTLADRGRIGGSGASMTPIGALAPHMAAPWTPLKAFQAAALARMPGEVAALEAETGLRVGYARLGRLQPLADAAARSRAEARLAEARALGLAEGMGLREGPGPDWPQGWPAPQAGGALHDAQSARIDPPALLAALRAGVARAGARMLEGWSFRHWAPGRAVFDRGEVRARAAVIAAGWESFALLPEARGEPEHGQAARLRCAAPPGAPLIGAPGLWIAPHADGTVGVGSTAQRGRSDLETDAGLDAVLERARALVPALAGAEVIGRWAGLRPRAEHGTPLVGPIPGRPGLHVAAGGFKIGLALAPAIGRAVAADLAGDPAAADPHLPESFRPPAPRAAPEA